MRFPLAAKFKSVFLLIGLLALLGCSRNLALTPHYRTTDLSILPANATVVVGSTEAFRAYLINEIGESREAESVSWWLLSSPLGAVEC